MGYRSTIAATIFVVVPMVMGMGSLGEVYAQDYDGMSCEQLWYERNAIYAAKGYCFKTQRARNVFGRGCFPPYGKLTPGEQRRVSNIEQWEVYQGCK